MTEKGCKAESAKGTGTPGEVWRTPGAGFQGPLPVETRRTCLMPLHQVVTAHVKCCLPGKLIRDPVPGFVLGAGHGAPSAWYLPGGQHVFSVHHILCPTV